MALSGFEMVSSWTDEGFRSTKVMEFRTRRSSASIATPLSYLLGQSAPHATLRRVYLVLEFGSNYPHHLGELFMQEHRSPVLDDYLATAFDQVVCGRLCADYPLIFSTQYSKKLSAITQYIPIFARTIERVITRSTTAESAQTQTQLQLQRSGSSAGSIALANVRAMGTRTKILRPPPPIADKSDTTTGGDDTEAIIHRDLVIGFYYSAKCTQKLTKVRCAATTPTPPVQDTQPHVVPYDEIADLWTVPEC